MATARTIRLVTKGARTGVDREVVLYAFADAGGLVVVGSFAGGPRHPGWVHNLRANPRAVVREGKDAFGVVADEVPQGEERERLWELVCEGFRYYRTYQRRTERLIPLFVLSTVD